MRPGAVEIVPIDSTSLPDPKKQPHDERDRANELERQGIEDRRNNEAELQQATGIACAPVN